MVAPVFQAQRPESLQRPLPAVFASVFVVEQGDFNVFQRRRAREQVESLKDKPDFLVADFSERVAAERTYVNPVEAIRAGGRLIQAADDIHKGGLAGARVPHHRHEFPPVDLKGNFVQRVDDAVAHFVSFFQMVRLDKRHGR